MSGRNFSSYAPMDQRVIELERKVSQLTRLVDAISSALEARWIPPGEKELIVLGKSIYGPIAKGAAGQFQVFEEMFPSETGAEPLTGINRFGYIGSDKWLIAVWVERCQGWYIVAAEC